MIGLLPCSSQLHGNGVPLSRNPPALALRTPSVAARAIADDVSFNRALQDLTSCSASRDLGTGSALHALVIKSGFSSDVIVGNSLLNVYSKCGSLESAKQVFDEMPLRTVVSWTTLMSGCCNHGEGDAVISLFWRMLSEVDPNEFAISVLLQACAHCLDTDGLRLVQSAHCYAIKMGFLMDSFLLNSMVHTYAKCGKLDDAEKILHRSDCKGVVSWTSLISSATLNGYGRDALNYFFQMQEDGITPNEITVLSLLRACSSIGGLSLFRWIHGLTVKSGWWLNDLVVNSLMELYLVNGFFLEGVEVFCKFLFSSEDPHFTDETLAVILQGCSELGLPGLGRQVHSYLMKRGIIPCLVIENSLMHMYAKDQQMDSAFQLFSRMEGKDIVSWNTIIAGLVRGGDFSEALLHFREMYREKDGQNGPDFVTALAMLQACSAMGSYCLGQTIHGFITKTGLACDMFLQNSLIDLYGKTGRLDLAQGVFEDMGGKDISSWNSIMAAYGLNGRGHSALELFKELKELGIDRPNEITFVNILSACVHAGLIEEGVEIFNSMEVEYGIEPSTEHFACVVGMLGRSGRLDDAEGFIRKMMPVTADRAVWGALLNSCSVFRRIDIAERVTRELLVLDGDSKAWRIAMSNAYATVGRFEDAAKLRLEVKERCGKDAGWSCVEVRGENVTFTVNDTANPICESIYNVLNSMTSHIRSNDYMA
ncbi:hypothetical protein SAY87_000368 [Trapa incisa]|uniref:Uncharacterized protein n=1 Tax=Trapa incisa TaxID=236973 RepID=A0AAN7GN43_9MYRT|nr:hypothetical protein SAY87_000368 [Trapa incisa]